MTRLFTKLKIFYIGSDCQACKSDRFWQEEDQKIIKQLIEKLGDTIAFNSYVKAIDKQLSLKLTIKNDKDGKGN